MHQPSQITDIAIYPILTGWRLYMVPYDYTIHLLDSQ